MNVILKEIKSLFKTKPYEKMSAFNQSQIFPTSITYCLLFATHVCTIFGRCHHQ